LKAKNNPDGTSYVGRKKRENWGKNEKQKMKTKERGVVQTLMAGVGEKQLNWGLNGTDTKNGGGTLGGSEGPAGENNR